MAILSYLFDSNYLLIDKKASTIKDFQQKGRPDNFFIFYHITFEELLVILNMLKPSKSQNFPLKLKIHPAVTAKVINIFH